MARNRVSTRLLLLAVLSTLFTAFVLWPQVGTGEQPKKPEPERQQQQQGLKTNDASIDLETERAFLFDAAKRSDEAWPPCFGFYCSRGGRCGTIEAMDDRSALANAVEEPPCCTQVLRDLLLATRVLLDELRAEWFVHYGTLLGFERSETAGGPAIIPWTADADLALRRSDLDKLLGSRRAMRTAIREHGLVPFRDGEMGRICAAKSFASGSLQRWQRGNISTLDRRAARNYKGYHPYVDLYVLEHAKWEEGERFFHTRSGPCQFRANDTFPLAESAPVFGVRFPVPKRPVPFLVSAYGQDWLEPQTDRRAHGRSSHICRHGF
jgi:hypothetical protein